MCGQKMEIGTQQTARVLLGYKHVLYVSCRGKKQRREFEYGCVFALRLLL